MGAVEGVRGVGPLGTEGRIDALDFGRSLNPVPAGGIDGGAPLGGPESPIRVFRAEASLSTGGSVVAFGASAFVDPPVAVPEVPDTAFPEGLSFEPRSSLIGVHGF